MISLISDFSLSADGEKQETRCNIGGRRQLDTPKNRKVERISTCNSVKKDHQDFHKE